ncbi:MAG TPA: hypothetical protein VFD84_05755 [Candidatus Binatia bacterium]|nr:hypothetical protein [Candidatus Binatia bacterium]
MARRKRSRDEAPPERTDTIDIELRHLRAENQRLKEMVEDLALDKRVLEEALGRKW